MEDFDIINKLGEGAYSCVYKVKRKSDGLEYALKKVKMGTLSTKEKENALNEVRLLASIQHPNIIRYKEAFFEERSKCLCIIMEHANKGDLLNLILQEQKEGRQLPEREIWKYLIGMVSGLKALHDLKIVHRDLKCANIFLSKEGNVKLGDLNVSKIAKRGLVYTQTGTPYYASPEVWQDKPYDQKSDMWSLGCVLYELTTLKPPFRADDMKNLYRRILKGIYPPIPACYSTDLDKVISSLLQVSPYLRPTCKNLMDTPMLNKHLRAGEEGGMPGEGSLLCTIKCPPNLSNLQRVLPKPAYQSSVDGKGMLRLRSAHNHYGWEQKKSMGNSEAGTPREMVRGREREIEIEQGVRMEIPPRSSKGSRERGREPKKYVYPNPSNPKIRPPLPYAPHLPRISHVSGKDQSHLDYIRYNNLNSNKENLLHYRKPQQHIPNYHYDEGYAHRAGSVDYSRYNNNNSNNINNARGNNNHVRPPLPANNPYLANILAPQNNYCYKRIY